MSSTIAQQRLVVGGLPVNVFTDTACPNRDVIILFLLHGQTENALTQGNIVHSVFGQRSRDLKKGLVIVTFDHRNHGHRLIDPKGNMGWTNNSETHNERHALDMYAIQTGSAKDVSFLIDFLTPYLYPNREHEIIHWGIAGISQGGHSTWLALAHEPRLSFGIPILGCPDFLTLISTKAQTSGISLDDTKYFPVGLRHLMLRDDASAMPYSTSNETNPFLGKKILVLSGADDKLVPWAVSQVFVKGLEVGENGYKKVVLQPGVGHVCSDEMITEMAVFLSNILAE